MEEQSRRQRLVVVGAGPVGSLAALYAARRGYDVEVYEMRNDLRDANTVPLNLTKSINLALSERGIHAIRHAGYPNLVDAVLADTIPMHGRMIHSRNGGKLAQESQQYDMYGRYISASDRADLNCRLLEELETQPNVKLLFNRKLTGCDFNRKLAWFEVRDMSKGYSKHGERPPELEIPFDFMIGADGAFSAVRYHLMKFAHVQFQQEYIDTLWCEFHMPALISHELNPRTHSFPISPNHLHIWPGGSFMFIAIPSINETFTCTLFMPAGYYEKIDQDPESLLDFFDTNIPGVVPDLITPEGLVKQYQDNAHLPLMSIKCSPYHHKSAVAIVGDAAHAMVPFYGQGMNAGLEDVRVLFDIMDQHSTSGQSSKLLDDATRQAALDAYTAYRRVDAHAINDLAMGNYREMRSDVQSPLYLLRKKFEESLNWYLPALNITTQYTRISFSNERYSDVIKSVQRQRKIFDATLAAAAVVGAGLAVLGWRALRHSR